MPIIVHSSQGTVTGMSGGAQIRSADGVFRSLKVGDVVQKGDVLLTTQDGIVEFTLADEVPRAVPAVAPPLQGLRELIAAIDKGDPEQAPAAGPVAEDGAGLAIAERVARIAEYAQASPTALAAVEAIAIAAQERRVAPEALHAQPSAGNSVLAVEEGPPVGLRMAAPTLGEPVTSLTVTEIPAIGEVRKADGAVLAIGAALTPAEVPGLVYVPPNEYDGRSVVGGFAYTVNAALGSVTHTVNILVAPVNDAPTAASDQGSTNEDTAVALTLAGQDVDGSVVAFTLLAAPADGRLLLASGATVVAGQTISLAQASGLRFEPNADFNGAVKFLYSAVDDRGRSSAPAEYALTVLPVDDAAILGTGVANLIEANAALTIGGTLTISDVDSPAAFVAQASTAGTYGSFSIGASGAWSYTASSAHNEFVGGTTYTDSFAVASSDGTTTSVTVNILGTNDAAVLSAATANLTETNVVLSTAGTLTISDVDSAASFVPQAGTAGTYGSFSIAANGAWSYTASTAHNEFAAGTTHTDTFSVASSDGTTTSVTINILGTNDAAVLSAATANLTESNAVLTTSGMLAISDVDSPATFVPQAGTAGTYGSFTIGANGAWSYTASTAHNEFAAGTTHTDTFSVASSDGTTTSVTINILGTNDAAVLSAATANLTETNAVLTTSGTLTISDVDSPAAFVAQAGTVGTYGSFTIGANGAWTYTASSAHNELVAGTTYTDSFSVASSDGTVRNVTINILGTNDAAVLGSAAANLTETNAVLSTSSTLVISDVDSAASFVPQAGTAGIYGSFTIGANGAWSYTGSTAHNEFAAGTTHTDTFSVASSDGTTTSVTVNILGTNDAAVLSAATANLTETNAVLSTAGTLTISDVDSPATFVPQAGTAGTYGSFSIGADGAWTYTASTAHNEFAAGTTQTDSFSVASSDGTTTSVTINILGTNDAAVLSAATANLTETNAVLSTAGTLTISDVDSAATFVAQAGTVGAYGSFSIGAGGAWSYTTSSPHDEFVQGTTYSDSFSVASTDGTSSSVTVNILGTGETLQAGPPTLTVPAAIASLVRGPIAVTSAMGLTQVNLERAVGVAAGVLDTIDPPPGPTTADAGTVNVIDGGVANQALMLQAGQRVEFDWTFFNGEDVITDIRAGFNDLLLLVVADPNGNKQVIQISSSEQAGPNINGVDPDATGTFAYTAAASGGYSFAWIVANGIDSLDQRESSASIAAPRFFSGANPYGEPVPFDISAQSPDPNTEPSLRVSVSGLQAGEGFSSGTDLGGGVWSFNAAELAGLEFLPAVGFVGDRTLTLIAATVDPVLGVLQSAPQVTTVTIATTPSPQGTDANDVLVGTELADLLFGRFGDDILNAGAGNDLLSGGAGSDVLSGGVGADTFFWTLADGVNLGNGAPIDRIVDFGIAPAASGGDVLDLRDLLVGELKAGVTPGNLEQYLDFDTSSTPGSTVLRISGNGGFAGGTYVAGAETQRIELDGVDLRAPAVFGLGAGATDNDVIAQLLQRGKLIADGP